MTGVFNREFAKYDQVQKAHTYRLAEGASDEFDDDYEIATLDFARFLSGSEADKAQFAQEFVRSLQEIGFAILTGHGVDPGLYDEIHDQDLDLFTTTPLDSPDATSTFLASYRPLGTTTTIISAPSSAAPISCVHDRFFGNAMPGR